MGLPSISDLIDVLRASLPTIHAFITAFGAFLAYLLAWLRFRDERARQAEEAARDWHLTLASQEKGAWRSAMLEYRRARERPVTLTHIVAWGSRWGRSRLRLGSNRWEIDEIGSASPLPPKGEGQRELLEKHELTGDKVYSAGGSDALSKARVYFWIRPADQRTGAVVVHYRLHDALAKTRKVIVRFSQEA